MQRARIVFVFALVFGLSAAVGMAATFTNGGITLTYPDNLLDCNPTFYFSTTGVDGSWPVQYDLFQSWDGDLDRIGGGSTTGDLNVSFTPNPLEAGDTRIYAIFVAVFVPGQDSPTILRGKWRVDCETRPNGEGCTPGFWKNHLDVWPISTNTYFDDVFGRDAFDPDITMLEAVDLRGGGLNNLSRHAAAAYLNAISPVVNYPLTAAEVVAAFQAAFDSGEYNDTKNDFEERNEAGCPY